MCLKFIGWGCFSRPVYTSSKPGKADDNFLAALVGGADVQRAARDALQGVEVQQLLLGAAPHDAFLVRAASQLRHRVAEAVVALRPLFGTKTHLPYSHREHQGCNTQVRIQFITF
jgi:hypothetical protein